MRTFGGLCVLETWKARLSSFCKCSEEGQWIYGWKNAEVGSGRRRTAKKRGGGEVGPHVTFRMHQYCCWAYVVVIGQLGGYVMCILRVFLTKSQDADSSSDTFGMISQAGGKPTCCDRISHVFSEVTVNWLFRGGSEFVDWFGACKFSLNLWLGNRKRAGRTAPAWTNDLF